MPKTRIVKEETVVKFEEKLSRARSVVLADYQGLTTKDLTELRDKLTPLQAEFTITKNSLMSLALKNSGLDQNPNLEGQTATLFAFDDETSPIKVLVKALKDISKGKIKAGFLGDQILDASKINQLASLPSKDELRGKTVGVLVAPLQGIVGVLQANLRNLVYALSEIQRSKGGV